RRSGGNYSGAIFIRHRSFLRVEVERDTKAGAYGPVAGRCAPAFCVKLESQELLLGRSDRVLRGLGDAELDDGLGLDLDGLAGLGVAADAGLALRLDELAESGDGELAVLLGLLHR